MKKHMGSVRCSGWTVMRDLRTSCALACLCAVYSRSIRARVSYIARAPACRSPDFDKAKPAKQKRYIDPCNTVQVFYPPAMRRIHRGIVESDPATRTRCGGIFRALAVVVGLIETDGCTMLLAGGRKSCKSCLLLSARIS